MSSFAVDDFFEACILTVKARLSAGLHCRVRKRTDAAATQLDNRPCELDKNSQYGYRERNER